MKIKTKYPYNDYNGYIVINPENRRNICLVHKITKKRTTVSYARYLISVKLKRFLTKEEQVDHINGDKTCDELKNLQILSKSENNLKNIIETNRTKKLVELICPNCKNNFIREVRQTHISKKGKYTTCSKNCNNNISRLGLSGQERIELGINQIVREFREGYK